MQIDVDNYRITSDDRQFILQEKKIQGEDTKTRVKGDVFYDDIGYYGKLDTLINSLLTLKIKRSNISSLNELKDEIVKQRKYLKETFGGI